MLEGALMELQMAFVQMGGALLRTLRWHRRRHALRLVLRHVRLLARRTCLLLVHESVK